MDVDKETQVVGKQKCLKSHAAVCSHYEEDNPGPGRWDAWLGPSATTFPLTGADGTLTLNKAILKARALTQHDWIQASTCHRLAA